MPLILDESGGFNIPPAIEEAEIRRRARVKLRGIGDQVLQSLVDGVEKRVRTDLPIVGAALAGQRDPGITRPEPSLLANDHRRGEVIRPEAEGLLSYAALSAEQQARGQNVLVVHLPARLFAGAVLALAGF